MAKAEIFGLVTQLFALYKMDLGTFLVGGLVMEIQGRFRSSCHPHNSANIVSQTEMFTVHLFNF